jgi:hypothetical protein
MDFLLFPFVAQLIGHALGRVHLGSHRLEIHPVEIFVLWVKPLSIVLIAEPHVASCVCLPSVSFVNVAYQTPLEIVLIECPTIV